MFLVASTPFDFSAMKSWPHSSVVGLVLLFTAQRKGIFVSRHAFFRREAGEGRGVK